MSQFQLYLTGLVLSVLISFAVIFYLRRPLFKLLVELCGTGDRARFWMQITHLSFVLTAMLMALTFSPDGYLPDYYYLANHLGRTLFGLLGVTGFLTIAISRFIRRTDSTAMPKRQTNDLAS